MEVRQLELLSAALVPALHSPVISRAVNLVLLQLSIPREAKHTYTAQRDPWAAAKNGIHLALSAADGLAISWV